MVLPFLPPWLIACIAYIPISAPLGSLTEPLAQFLLVAAPNAPKREVHTDPPPTEVTWGVWQTVPCPPALQMILEARLMLLLVPGMLRLFPTFHQNAILALLKGSSLHCKHILPRPATYRLAGRSLSRIPGGRSLEGSRGSMD